MLSASALEIGRRPKCAKLTPEGTGFDAVPLFDAADAGAGVETGAIVDLCETPTAAELPLCGRLPNLNLIKGTCARIQLVLE